MSDERVAVWNILLDCCFDVVLSKAQAGLRLRLFLIHDWVELLLLLRNWLGERHLHVFASQFILLSG